VKAFTYVNPTNEREAVAALSGTRGRVLPLAGGQDLIALMKDYVLQPDQVVNVKTLDAAIEATPDGGLRIGSAVRLSDLAAHRDVQARYPALAEAAAEVGTPQIRHIGTVGGNLCQRPRCWYFRNEEFHCLKKAGPRCYAVDGENQFHAILGGGPCHIVHPSSIAVPLVAFGARMRVVGPSGEREVAAGDFFVLPEQRLMYENVLDPNELVTHVTLPRLEDVRSATYEVRYKQAFDWPIAFATAVLTMDGSRVDRARIVMGAVAPIPWRSEAAEHALAGQPLGEAAAEGAAAAALQDAQPMTGNAYKVQVARTAVRRAVLKAAGLLNV
jgi:xanthine dehydrogenase YagS FAD-binding subunit